MRCVAAGNLPHGAAGRLPHCWRRVWNTLHAWSRPTEPKILQPDSFFLEFFLLFCRRRVRVHRGCGTETGSHPVRSRASSSPPACCPRGVSFTWTPGTHPSSSNILHFPKPRSGKHAQKKKQNMATLILEDGTTFKGLLFGANASVSGEVGKSLFGSINLIY